MNGENWLLVIDQSVCFLKIKTLGSVPTHILKNVLFQVNIQGKTEAFQQ